MKKLSSMTQSECFSVFYSKNVLKLAIRKYTESFEELNLQNPTVRQVNLIWTVNTE